MKRFFILTMTLFLCFVMSFPVLATSSTMPRLVDNANLLTESEEQTLLTTLDEISNRQQVDIVVVTVNSLGVKSAQAYADDFYDENGYGFGASYDGILLLLSMEERDWHISTCGYAITAFTDAGLDHIADQILPHLSSGNYAKAFSTYATLCDDYIAKARNGTPYDVGTLPKAPFSAAKNLLGSVVIGIVAAIVVTLILKSQLKSVRRQSAANTYIRQNSMNITTSHDRFLYRNVSRRAKPQNNSSGGGSSTHRSSSGRSHGGRGGKF